MTITKTQIEAAAARIAPHVRVTPLLDVSGTVGLPARLRVTLKMESLQHAGSFKSRGAFNTMLSAALPASGVIAASGGNHGAAVAYAAQQLGVRAEIFVPTIASPAKVARIQQFGATITQVGDRFALALAASELRQHETGALAIHAYDAPATLAGQGTLAREFAQQVQTGGGAPLDAVLVAVGGGGLIGGIATWFAGSGTQVFAVETEGTATLHRALAARERVEVPVSGLAADSLGASRIGELAFEVATQHVAHSVLVTDDDVKAAQRWLWQNTRQVAEPGGAAALAALRSGKYAPAPGAHVGIVMCGANCDPASVV
jgi:threonine dehydratase